jgi:hypothetical protein
LLRPAPNDYHCAVKRKAPVAPTGIDPNAGDVRRWDERPVRKSVPSTDETSRRRKRTAPSGQLTRHAPEHEPEVARSVVLKALDELVDVGLGTWLERADGSLELHLLSGQRWLLEGDGMTRLA